MSITTFLLKPIAKKALTLKNAILKPVRERCNLAIDLIGKRNPADFASREELSEHLSKLLKEQKEMGNVTIGDDTMIISKTGLFDNIQFVKSKYARQLESDIDKTKQLIKIMV